MSVLSRTILLKKLENKEYRDAYVTEHVKSGIAFQIRALRKKKSLSQEQLAAAIETKQAVISRLENPDYGNININTLYKIASAFDVALLVKFVPYTKLLNETKDLSPKALAVDDFISENNALNTYAELSSYTHSSLGELNDAYLSLRKWHDTHSSLGEHSEFFIKQTKEQNITNLWLPRTPVCSGFNDELYDVYTTQSNKTNATSIDL